MDPLEAFDLAPHSHDAFFKAMFSDIGRATAFFKAHLPCEIAARADWATLALLPGSFVKSTLREAHSDLFFSLDIGGLPARIYLLFEHQSTVPPAMPLRMLGYVTDILTDHHKRHGLPLPPVLPFVFHQGPDEWTISPAFEDLFELPPECAVELLAYLPRFRHALLDLTRFDPARAEGDATIQIILQLMKLARMNRMRAYFEWLAANLADQLPDSLLKRMLIYALHADEDLDPETIYHSLSANPDLAESIMSTAQMLKDQGRDEGRVEGRTEGEIRGRFFAAIQLLQEQLGRPVDEMETLRKMDNSELETLRDRLKAEWTRRFKST